MNLDILINYFQRMKYHILLSLIIFLSFTLISYFYPSVFQSLVLPAVQRLQEGVQQGTVKLETTALFVNNFSVALNIIISGLYFSVPSTYLLIYNAAVVGFTGAHLNFYYFILYTLPHGIFELTGIIFSGSAAFRITQSIITILKGIQPKKENKSIIFKNHLKTAFNMLFDALVMIIIVMILLLIAAYVEANLTIPFAQGIIGI